MNRHPNSFSKPLALKALALTAGALALTAAAQTTWTGGGGDDLWNTAGNWDTGVPVEGVPATIGAGASVSYDAPMAATSFGGLDLGGALSVNADGFVVDAFGGVPVTVQTGGVFTVTADGVVVITNSGSFTMSTPDTSGTSPVLDVEGGTLILTSDAGDFYMGEGANKDNNVGAVFTNNFGNVVVASQFRVKSRDSRFYMPGGTLDLQGGLNLDVSQNDMRQFFRIAGGTANLGDVIVNRASTSGGLSIEGGVVNSTSVRDGIGNAAGNARITGGVWTNSGSFFVGDRSNGASSKDRRIYFRMDDGELVTLGADGIIVNNQGQLDAQNLSNVGGTLDVNGGALTAAGIQLNGPAVTNFAYARFELSGGTVYLGSLGIVANTNGADMTAVITLTGGTLGAMEDWTGSGDMNLSSGTTTIQAADGVGAAKNITLTGALTGNGNLAKTGAGKLSLQGVGSHTGEISVDEGTLALEAGGSLATTPVVSVGAGAMFDVGTGYTLNDTQTLGGGGMVTNDVSAASGSTIRPGGLTTIDTLTFANSLTENGGVINAFNVGGASQDMLVVNGVLNLSGMNTLQVTTVGGVPGGAYKLIDYGTMSGGVGNLDLVGVTGSLSNSVAEGAIYLVFQPERPATNLVWVGDSSQNLWNNGAAQNWVNNSTAFTFLPGDQVTFDDSGSQSPPVNVTEDVAPAALTVDASVDYTIEGVGRITGLTGLAKTNSGKLTLLTENDYLGKTTIAGGTLSVSNLANGGLPSAIGASAADSENLVLDGGTMEYTGVNASSDRGMTLDGSGGTISVTSTGEHLSIGGPIVGDGALTKQGEGDLYLATANSFTGGTVVEAGILRADQGGNASITAFGTNTLTLNGETTPAVLQFDADQQKLGNNTLSVVGTNNYTQNNGNNAIGDLVGDGTLILDSPSGSTLTIEGDMSGFSGTLVVGTLPNLRLHPSTGSASATFDLGVGNGYLNNRNATPVIQLGALKGGPYTVLQGASSSGNPTTYTIGGNNASTLFEGAIADDNGEAAINKVGTGTLSLAGTSYYTGDTTITEGTLALVDYGVLYSTANINVAAGAVLDVSGLVTPILYLNYGQVLRGNGSVVGSVDSSYGGDIAPGDSIGTLTVSGDANLYRTVMEVNRAATPNADKLVAANIYLGGELVITNIGFNLQPGDEFDLFDGTVTDGGYYITGPAGTTFDTSRLISDGIISVASVPAPPVISGIVTESGTNVVLNGSGGVPYGMYDVLSSDDVAMPVATWTPVQTGLFFDADGNFSFTNAIDSNAPATFFLIHQQ